MLSTRVQLNPQGVQSNQSTTPDIIITPHSSTERDSLTSKFRVKKTINNNNNNNNNNSTSPHTREMMSDYNGSDQNKHSYSCKRCRRLKKKCTRTVLECHNCTKAGETCEYVPRAPRRKKSEILKSLQEQRQAGQNQQNDSNRSPLSSTPVLRTQDSNLHFTNMPKINQLNNLQPNNIGPSLSHLRSEPFNQQQSSNNFIEKSPRSFNMGTTDPFSYKSNNNSSLPPLSSITTNISNQPPHQQQQQQQQGPSDNLSLQPQSQPQQQQQQQITSPSMTSQQLNNSYPVYRFSPPATRQPSDDSQAKVQINQQRSPLMPQEQSQLKPMGLNMQNRLLTSILGIDDFMEHNLQVIRPNLEKPFMIQLVSTFFKENFHSYPFLERNDIIQYLLFNDFQKLDSLPSKESFEIFMIMFIGYCSMERVGAINTDVTLKRYLISKSIEQASNVITFDNIESIKYLLLLGIYSLFDVAGFTSWHIAGNITRLTLSLGLNRNSAFRSRNGYDREAAEAKNRVFWSAYNFDRFVSISLGRPFGIDDDDINIPFPTKLQNDDGYDIELITAIISLRQIEGKILKNIHSVNAGTRNITEDAKLDVLKTLRIEVEDWYNLTNNLTRYQKNPIYNVSWFTANYYQLTMLLYRPSFLIPKPPKETLLILGKACLQCLAYTYNLHTSNLLQPSWVTVYRFLTQCTTIIYCLCHWCIDLIESKTEINLCIEILEGFGDRWPVSAKSAQIFKDINKNIYDLKVTPDWQLIGVESLTNKFFEASRAYHDILSNNNVDIWFDDPVIVNSEQ